MSLLRWLGIEREAGTAPAAAQTSAVRAISARLERLDPQLARYLAAFGQTMATASCTNGLVGSTARACWI